LVKTIIYLTKEKIRLAQCNVSNESCVLLKEKKIPLEQSSFDAEVLKSAVLKEGFSAQRLHSCLFRHEVGVRFFSFPSHDPQEIARMAAYESAELLPLKPEETTTRHLVLESRSDGYSKTLVVVTHREEMTKRIEQLQAAGIIVDTLSLSSLALFNCVRRLAGATTDTVMVVYGEDAAVEILIIKDGKLVLSRGFLVIDQKTFAQVLISEVRHSMEALHHAEPAADIKCLIVGGCDTDLTLMSGTLSGHFEIPVTIEKSLDIACGLAMPGGARVNLLSDALLAGKTRARLKKKILITGMLFVINSILIGTVFTVSFRHKARSLEALQTKLSRIMPQAKAVQDKLTQLRLVRHQLRSQALILDAITDLMNAASASCTLTMLSINEEGVLIVHGQTENLQAVLDLVTELEKSEHIEKSRLNYSSRRKTKDKELLDFEIQAALRIEP
jgi:Tfp pilus assembly protein PilN